MKVKIPAIRSAANDTFIAEVALLKIGRHFRFGRNKIIVGRNQTENNILAENKTRYDYFFEVADVGSPLTLLRGPKTKKAIRKAAELTAFYSDAKNSSVIVKFGKEKLDKSILVSAPSREEVECLRIG